MNFGYQGRTIIQNHGKEEENGLIQKGKQKHYPIAFRQFGIYVVRRVMWAGVE
jgi:hypothetical protein